MPGSQTSLQSQTEKPGISDPQSLLTNLHAKRLISTRSVQSHLPYLLLILLITGYAVYFSAYTINRHNTLNSYAADLSLIDQPMWNTVRGPGGFMELTWGDRQQPRLAEHFEPILVPLAFLYFVWDDVRILLIAQSVALALGALPVFWIARSQLSISNVQLSKPSGYSDSNSQSSENASSRLSSWIALVFAGSYLLYPHLQAANIADFHADPFVVMPLLFAFWYATRRRWGWMWVWAIMAMSTKETLPTLTAMLGVWLLWAAYHQRRRQSPGNDSSAIALHGLSLVAVSAIWFLIATFFIVSPLAQQYFGTDGPIYLENRYRGGPAELLSLLQDPARWQYLFGLLAAVGFLPLLAPELLILGLPVLAANLFSNFPGQYSGEQHYSAPLVAAFIIAAIGGTRQLAAKVRPGEKKGQSHQITALLAATLWLLSWSLGYHAVRGWTPLSSRLENYRATPASVVLRDFAAQIPPEAVVSASAAIHPHLAHRHVIYVFPTVQDAAYLLVDVTDIPGVHPNDSQARLLNLLDQDWQLLRASQGLILAQRSSTAVAGDRSSLPEDSSGSRSAACSSALPLPCAFYDFVRARKLPAHSTALTFGDERLRLLGYDLLDDPDDGVTVRFYWQTPGKPSAGLHLWPLIYDDTGRLVTDPRQVPMIATVWYPPTVWQPDEIVVTETLPQHLPDIFHVGIAVGPEDSYGDPKRRLAIDHGADGAVRVHPGHWAQLATLRRQGPYFTHFPVTPSLRPLTATQIQFGPTIQLTGYWFDESSHRSGDTLPILLRWSANQSPPSDYTVFVHLLDAEGRLVAQNDAFPTWLWPAPTSQWRLDRPYLDSHLLALPENLPPGKYRLELGLYHSQTLERLTLLDGRNSLTVGQVEVK